MLTLLIAAIVTVAWFLMNELAKLAAIRTTVESTRTTIILILVLFVLVAGHPATRGIAPAIVDVVIEVGDGIIARLKGDAKKAEDDSKKPPTTAKFGVIADPTVTWDATTGKLTVAPPAAKPVVVAVKYQSVTAPLSASDAAVGRVLGDGGDFTFAKDASLIEVLLWNQSTGDASNWVKVP